VRGSGIRLAAGTAGLLIAVAAAWIRCGPLPAGFLDEGRHVSTVVKDRRGALLYESLSAQGSRSAWISPEHLPPPLVSATLAAEDRRFDRHPGIDLAAVARALLHDVRRGRLAEGGSTITQQVVKRLAARRHSVTGKIREALLALRLEHRLSKPEILALYLNLAPYGNTYVGAAAASRGYFGCPPENLTPAQAAFLAGLPQRPSTFDPYRDFARARKRQRWVLARMAAVGALRADDLRTARAERLALSHAGRPCVAPHFVQRVLARAGRDGRVARVIETTLDAALQAEVSGILEAQRRSLAAHGAHDAAVAVLDNSTGEWLAWEGSGDYFDREHGGAIDGVASPRQPGSALKPFTYALAFERGSTPADVLPDVPSSFPTAVAGVVYQPRNYDGVFRGPLRARAALAGSENVPAVWMLSRVGVAPLLRLLRSAGLTTLDRTADYYGFALTMGDAEVRLDELVAAYSALSRGGMSLAPREIRRIEWTDGSVWAPETAAAERVVSERSAFWVTDILSDAQARAYVFGRGGSLEFSFPVAVKTGTSQAYRDNWTIGYTREVTVGVWVGNFDRSPLVGSSGVTGAGPIFHSVLLAAEKRVLGRFPTLADPALAQPPPGVSRHEICALSGMAATPDCPRVISEWLPVEASAIGCTWHRRHSRPDAVAWPGRFRAWAADRGLIVPAAGSRRVPARPAGARYPREPLRIESPPSDAAYLRDPTLRPEFQTLALRAVVDGSPRRLTWSVDGAVVGSCDSDRFVAWRLSRGEHRVDVADEMGHRDKSTITVR
jgi:penicillin-binding protein 1C